MTFATGASLIVSETNDVPDVGELTQRQTCVVQTKRRTYQTTQSVTNMTNYQPSVDVCEANDHLLIPILEFAAEEQNREIFEQKSPAAAALVMMVTVPGMTKLQESNNRKAAPNSFRHVK